MSHRHLVELIARHPEALEPDLKIADTLIPTLGNDYIDFIGMDSERRMIIGVARNEPQMIKPRSGNILTEAVNIYHWILDYREEFMSGIKTRLGKKPGIRQPPRLLIIAPEFDQEVLDLGAHALDRFDVEMYTYFTPGGNGSPIAFSRSKPGNPDAPSPARKKSLFASHSKKIEEQRAKYEEFFDEKEPVRAYAFSSLEEQTSRVEESLKEMFAQTVERILTLDADLRPLYRPNRLSFLNPVGEEIAEITIGPGGGYSLTCRPAKGRTKLQFSPQESDAAISAVAEAAGK